MLQISLIGKVVLDGVFYFKFWIKVAAEIAMTDASAMPVFTVVLVFMLCDLVLKIG